MKLLTFLLLLAGSSSAVQAVTTPQFELEPWARTPASGRSEIPWLTGSATLPNAQKPQFILTSTATSARAEGWVAARASGLFLRVRVTDPTHRQDKNAAQLYEGDSLQFAVDALGNGAPTGSVVAVRRDDADYGLALHQSGAIHVWSYYHGQPGRTGLRTDLHPAITRDDTSGVTLYEILLPWEEFGLAAGVSDHIGLAVQLNDATPGQGGVIRMKWGDGLGGQFRPHQFQRLVLAPPTEPLFALTPLKDTLLGERDTAEWAVVLPTATAATLEAALDETAQTFALPAEKGDDQLRRYRLRGAPGEWVNGSKIFRASLRADGETNFACAAQMTLRDNTQERWYAFRPADDLGPSVIGMEDWLDRPAGQRGWLGFEGGVFRFADGTPVKFWGVNDQYASVAPPTNEAVIRARQYAKYGVNAVRVHKWCEPGWAGIGHTNDATLTEAKGLERFDYMHAQLREHGIYAGWSPFFGHKVRPGNRSEVLAYDELVAKVHGGTYGLVNFAPDLQDLMIRFAVNMLNHTNAFTGLRYADDPALAYVEMHNEDDIQWFAVQNAINQCPTYKRQLQSLYADWLTRRYGDEAGLLAAWGPTALNSFLDIATNESLRERTIAVIANPWFSEPASLDQMEREKGARKRLLDNFLFLYETQNAFYDRYRKAIRDTGYQGVLLGSCWQSIGLGHYYNIHSDRRIGFIDRHNYYSGTGLHFLRTGPIIQPTSLLANPVGDLLATGLQAVDDRPFSVSEWDSVVPNEWRAEAPALMAFYGLGLQGWDASFQFVSDRGTFSPTIEKPGQVFNVQHPTQLGLYPLYARAIARGDLREGDPVGARNVYLPDLMAGRLDFREAIEQSGDRKSFTGDTPAAALALGKVALHFTEERVPSTLPDFSEALATRILEANTGQLIWNYTEPGREFVMVNSPGTRGLLGFSPPREFALGGVRLRVDNRFAVVLMTSLDRKAKDLEQADRVLLCAVARAYNTGMRYNESGDVLEEAGKAPIVMEPVWADVLIPGATEVHLLDHDGRRTDRTLPVTDGRFHLNGVADQTPYYEIVRNR